MADCYRPRARGPARQRQRSMSRGYSPDVTPRKRPRDRFDDEHYGPARPSQRRDTSVRPAGETPTPKPSLDSRLSDPSSLEDVSNYNRSAVDVDAAFQTRTSIEDAQTELRRSLEALTQANKAQTAYSSRLQDKIKALENRAEQLEEKRQHVAFLESDGGRGGTSVAVEEELRRLVVEKKALDVERRALEVERDGLGYRAQAFDVERTSLVNQIRAYQMDRKEGEERLASLLAENESLRARLGRLERVLTVTAGERVLVPDISTPQRPTGRLKAEIISPTVPSTAPPSVQPPRREAAETSSSLAGNAPPYLAMDQFNATRDAFQDAIAALSAQIHAQQRDSAALAARSQEIEARSADVERKEAAVSASQTTLLKNLQAAVEKKKVVDEREKALESRERLLQERETVVQKWCEETKGLVKHLTDWT